MQEEKIRQQNNPDISSSSAIQYVNLFLFPVMTGRIANDAV